MWVRQKCDGLYNGVSGNFTIVVPKQAWQLGSIKVCKFGSVDVFTGHSTRVEFLAFAFLRVWRPNFGLHTLGRTYSKGSMLLLNLVCTYLYSADGVEAENGQHLLHLL